MSRPGPQRIAAVRRFNRFYTRQIGVLRKTYLDSPYSLGEMRVLYEIARGDGPTASDIARALDLDAGYLSRVLRNFEKRGLIARKTSKADARQSHLSLTTKGRKTFDPIERRSQDDVAKMLDRLTPEDQARLVHAMISIETLLDDDARETARGFTLREPQHGDFGWIVSAHARLYAEEYDWTGGFEGLCAQIVADYIKNFDPKARGLGLGKRLVDECVQFARAAGYTSMTLWTHSVLSAARHTYEKAGFTLTSSEPRHSFGKDVVAEFWDLAL